MPKQKAVPALSKSDGAAKIWTLLSPDGAEYTCQNLSEWIRKHTDLFGREQSEAAVRSILLGFTIIAQSLRGTRKQKRFFYKGWTLKDVPLSLGEKMDEDMEDKREMDELLAAIKKVYGEIKRQLIERKRMR